MVWSLRSLWCAKILLLLLQTNNKVWPNTNIHERLVVHPAKVCYVTFRYHLAEACEELPFVHV